ECEGRWHSHRGRSISTSVTWYLRERWMQAAKRLSPAYGPRHYILLGLTFARILPYARSDQDLAFVSSRVHAVTMKIIVPCAGRSSRFPNMPPKWMLPDYDGVPMVVKAVQGLGVPVEDIIVTVLKEHEERFNALEGLRQAFGREVRGVILEKSTA
ncbi:hypothetical protein KXV85_005342, partial [Aspergillus fumigatus]